MANDFNKPTVSDNYATTLIPTIKDNQAALAQALDPAVVTVTNPPTNAVRWNSANGYWEKYNGSSWAALAATYGISISGNAGTATKLATGRTIAVTGDATGTSSAFDGSANCSFSVTLATVNSNVGSFGSATQGLQVTVNAKGLITAISAVTITPAWSSVTSKPTTLGGYGITDAAPIASPTFTGTVTFPAGTTTVAPVKWQAGSKLTAPVAHVFEYDGTYLYQTTSAASRKQIAYADGTGASGSWGISITGSSASCTGNAATASSCSGNSATATTASACSGNSATATTATNIAGGSGGSISYQSAAGTTAMLANGAAGQVLTSSGGTSAPVWSSIAFSPVRQTVLGGPVDTNGFPSFLPGTSGSLSLTSQNITSGAPFVASAANGFGATGVVDRIGSSTVNLTWSGLTANTTNYLYVDVSANGTLTAGRTTLAPTYQFGGTRSTSNGQATFNIQEMSMTVGNGSTAPQTYRVFVGEAVTNAGTVTSTVAYAYLGKYRSATVNTLPSAGTTTNFNHNLGIPPQAILKMPAAFGVCLTADNGWSVGEVMPLQTYLAAAALPYRPESITGRNTAAIVAGVTNAWSLLVRSTGNNQTATLASWGYYMTVDRGW